MALYWRGVMCSNPVGGRSHHIETLRRLETLGPSSSNGDRSRSLSGRASLSLDLDRDLVFRRWRSRERSRDRRLLSRSRDLDRLFLRSFLSIV